MLRPYPYAEKKKLKMKISRFSQKQILVSNLFFSQGSQGRGKASP